MADPATPSPANPTPAPAAAAAATPSPATPPATPGSPSGPAAQPGASTRALPLKRNPRWRRWLAVPLVLAALVLGACYMLAPENPDPFLNLAYLTADHPLKKMTNPEFEQQVDRDLREFGILQQGLQQVNTDLAALTPALPPDAGHLTPEQRRTLKALWMRFIDHQIALYRLKDVYKVFPGISRFDAPADNWRHARCFALALHIHLTQIESAWQFLTAFNGRKDYESILDEADRDFGIPSRAYAKLKFHVLHLQTIAEIRAMQVHFLTLESNHYQPFAAKLPGAADAQVWTAVARGIPRVMAQFHSDGVQQVTKNAEDLLKEGLFKSWFPVQKNVSEWMGDTQIATRKSLITIGQIETMQKSLQPGDILLERRNWYLSNVGLPGFWPHAALYIGTFEEFEQSMAGDDGVKAFLAAQGCDSVKTLLVKKHPALLADWQQPHHDHPARVIESVSEGVVLSSLEHSCLADYVCAMRPRFSAVDRLKAILAAFGHWSKPYDFDFDFITDDKIVCSELVFKSWRPDTDKRGVQLSLKEVMGRKVLPSNEFVGLFQAELEKPDRQLDFVYFLEGVEKDRAAKISDAAALAASFNRPKWDILQE